MPFIKGNLRQALTLMNFITEEVYKITTDMCQKVIQCFHRRLHTCVKNGDSSVEKY